ncbi:MAG TPA: benzoyl-CoA-dihydrodiol lyase, partial [Polyangiaceae bacterium]|nr:benzoyl-CoA-dihydrodiol lyase [Polyangiaceae bacterium]
MAISFQTHPDKYKHWTLNIDGERAELLMDVEPFSGLREGYELKLNSYDLGVDIELADAVQRLRFEHPEVKVVVVKSGQARVFCAGANIPMLGSSTHAFKVNFCKFTNETRLYLEDASQRSGLKFVAALNGTCAGGGYELAMACDYLLLIDDGSSAVSLPEVPLLGVLPGTGGLTRLVDKRRVRRDRADVFCTTSEGMRGKRAVKWGLVDEIAARSKFDDAVSAAADKLAETVAGGKGPGIELEPIEYEESEDGTLSYRYVTLEIDADTRTARLTIRTPDEPQPTTAEEIQAAGSSQWSLRAFRELDDALLQLRLNHLEVGLVILRATGDAARVVAIDDALDAQKDHWLANEIRAFQGRVLRRVDVTSKSFFTLIDEGTAFGGVLLELALASDRIYMLEDDAEQVAVALSSANFGSMPMTHGLTRLQARFLDDADQVAKVAARRGAPIPTTEA